MSPVLVACIFALFTDTFVDDNIGWDAVLDADLASYHVEGRTIQPGVATIAWSVHTTLPFHRVVCVSPAPDLVTCLDDPVDIYVWAVDTSGNHSRLPGTFIWTPNGFRRLDDSNTPGRWVGRGMCDVVTP